MYVQYVKEVIERYVAGDSQCTFIDATEAFDKNE